RPITTLQICGINQRVYDGIRYVCFLFKTNQYKGELISTREGENFWIKRKDLYNYELASNFVDMIQVFENDDLSEQFRTYVHGKKVSILK
nr:hypothetical protein [Anaeroplasmataceae bacterium]